MADPTRPFKIMAAGGQNFQNFHSAVAAFVALHLISIRVAPGRALLTDHCCSVQASQEL